MNRPTCELQEKLFDRILSADIIEPNQQEKLHIDSCEACSKLFAEIKKNEYKLSQEKNKIIKSVPVPTIDSLITQKTVTNSSINKSLNIFDLPLLFKLSLVLSCVLLFVAFFKHSDKKELALDFTLASGILEESHSRILKCDSNQTLPRTLLLKAERRVVIRVKGKIEAVLNKATFVLDNSEIKLKNGQVTAEVFKKGTKFSISTSNARFRVIGTKFSVLFNKKTGSLLKVYSGRVWVNTKLSESYVATKNENILVNPEGKITKVSSSTIKKLSHPLKAKTKRTNLTIKKTVYRKPPLTKRDKPNPDIAETKSLVTNDVAPSNDGQKNTFMDSVLSAE